MQHLLTSLGKLTQVTLKERHADEAHRSSDGLTLVISSSDGFCSTLSFAPGELGEVYKGETGPSKAHSGVGTSVSSQNTPTPTPTSNFAPPSPYPNGPHHQHRNSASSFTAPSPPASTSAAPQRPSSPTRSNSTSSVATQSGVVSNPPLISGNVPGIAATNSAKVTGVPLTTPPETPKNGASGPAGNKRDASDMDKDESKEPKKRRIAPTLVEAKPQ